MNSLFKDKTFKPFFSTQFLGAFNDNVFKNALAVFITYQAINEVEAGKISGLAGALFIAPYILFSMFAGQLSDKYEKSAFIKKTKLAELIIMLLGAVGFWFSNVYFLLLVLFLMGTQSTFFGPAKYSLLPQVFKEDEALVAATSYVEMGTFLAILMGTIGGGLLIGMGPTYVSMSVVVFAFLGWFASLKIPKVSGGENPSIKISLNPFKQVKSLLSVTFQNKSVFVSILLISWFWFFGAIFLQQIAVFVRYMINADKAFVTVFLSAFTLSLSLGSVASNFLSNKKIELALIPIGAIGMSVFALDLNFISYPIFVGENPIVLSELFSSPSLWSFSRAVFDFFCIGFFGSFYIVPLYALMQRRSSASNCSQVIASNNIINSFFMIASSVYTIYFYKFGFNTTQLLASVGILNILVLIASLFYMPELWQRSFIFFQSKFFVNYKLKFKQGLKSKSAVIIGKKESIHDLMMVSYFLNKPVKVFANLRNRSFVEKVIKFLTCYTIFKKRHKKANEKKIISHLNKNELIYMTEKSFRSLTREKKNEFIAYCREHKIPVFLFSAKSISKDLSKPVGNSFFFFRKQSLLLSLDHLSY